VHDDLVVAVALAAYFGEPALLALADIPHSTSLLMVCANATCDGILGFVMD
jgi:hypothetical protein